MTPYQLNLMAEDYNLRRKEEFEDKLALTYLGAHWQRVKKMPNLKQLLGNQEPPKKKMTSSEMLEQVKQLNEIFGGKVITKGGEELGSS